MKPLFFDAEAETEFLEAADFYEADSPAVAWRFVQAVLAAVAAVQRAPREWPLSPDVPEHLDVRRCRVDGFPYGVVYAFDDTEIRILAIAHGKRQPGYWRERVEGRE